MPFEGTAGPVNEETERWVISSLATKPRLVSAERIDRDRFGEDKGTVFGPWTMRVGVFVSVLLLFGGFWSAKFRWWLFGSI